MVPNPNTLIDDLSIQILGENVDEYKRKSYFSCCNYLYTVYFFSTVFVSFSVVAQLLNSMQCYKCTNIPYICSIKFKS